MHGAQPTQAAPSVMQPAQPMQMIPQPVPTVLQVVPMQPVQAVLQPAQPMQPVPVQPMQPVPVQPMQPVPVQQVQPKHDLQEQNLQGALLAALSKISVTEAELQQTVLQHQLQHQHQLQQQQVAASSRLDGVKVITMQNEQKLADQLAEAQEVQQRLEAKVSTMQKQMDAANAWWDKRQYSRQYGKQQQQQQQQQQDWQQHQEMPPPDPAQQQQCWQQQHEKQQQQWGKKKRKLARVCNICKNQTYEGGAQGCTTAGCEVNRPEMKERKQAKIDEEKANRHLQIALMSEQLQNLTKIMLARGGQVVPERPMPAWPEEEKAETDVEKPEDEKKQETDVEEKPEDEKKQETDVEKPEDEKKQETDVEKPEDEKKQADEKKETADEQKLNPDKLSE